MFKLRTKPISFTVLESVTTAGEAVAIPSQVATRVVRVHADDDVLVGFGFDDTPPVGENSDPPPNTAFQKQDTTQDYILDGIAELDGTYVYIYSADEMTPADAVVSFLG